MPPVTPAPTTPDEPGDGVECAPGCGRWGTLKCSLVVALHGDTDYDASELRVGLFANRPMFDESSFCILFARSASGEAWDVQDHSKDVPHLLATTSAAMQTHNIDRGKVFLLGYSQGSVAAYLTVCTQQWENPFAAVVAVASQLAPYTIPGFGDYEFCCPNPNFHLMHVHGTHDDVQPLDVKLPWSCGLPGPIVWKHGKKDNNCGAATYSTSAHMNASVKAYEEGCDTGGSSALYTLDGAGHDIVTTALWRDAWAFFMKHTRPGR